MSHQGAGESKISHQEASECSISHQEAGESKMPHQEASECKMPHQGAGESKISQIASILVQTLCKHMPLYKGQLQISLLIACAGGHEQLEKILMAWFRSSCQL
jgi:hypothetical protein